MAYRHEGVAPIFAVETRRPCSVWKKERILPLRRRMRRFRVGFHQSRHPLWLEGKLLRPIGLFFDGLPALLNTVIPEDLVSDKQSLPSQEGCRSAMSSASRITLTQRARLAGYPY